MLLHCKKNWYIDLPISDFSGWSNIFYTFSQNRFFFALVRNYLMMGGLLQGPDNIFARNSRIFRTVSLRWNLLRGNTYGTHSTQESVTCADLCVTRKLISYLRTNYRGVLHAFLCLLRIPVFLIRI